MKLITSGEVNPYYIQTLCLIFFPGAKFAEDEEITNETPVVTVDAQNSDEGVQAKVSIRIGDHVTFGEAFVPHPTKKATVSVPKVAVGKAFSAAAEEFFGYIPSWGILTGIRPSKISGQIYREGHTPAQVRKILRDEYMLNPKKAALLTEITLNEARLVDSIDRQSCSLYISIPFCPTRCAYCSFVSFATKRLLSMIPEYLERLVSDLDLVLRLIKEQGLKLRTVYIGGGTPTTLTAAQLEMIFDKIEEYVDTATLDEFTLEAGRPDTITMDKLTVAKDHGVSRISINAQTMNDEVLKAIGRCHSEADFVNAFEMARQVGIKCINTDLIAGLPGEGYRSFSKSVDKVIKLRPENLTVHTFCVKKAASIARSAEAYSQSIGDARKSVDYSQLKAKGAGYIPYYIYRQKNTVGNLENVGFSQPGFEGLYNVYIMEELQHIFAVGAGAVTKLVDRSVPKIERIFMPKYPFEYLREDHRLDFEKQYAQDVREFFRKYPI